MNKNISEKKKLVLLIVIAIVVVASFCLIFKNNIIAMQKGVDVKYINDPLYCEQDSDCVIQGNSCDVVNKYNYEESKFACQLAICNPTCNGNNKCYE